MKKTTKKTKPTKRGSTGRSRAQESLGDSELRYRRLFETAQDGILILNALTGAITDVNPFLIAMLGYSRDEFIGKKLWQVGAFRDVQASQDAFEALQMNEYIRYEDLPLKAKDGRLIQVEFVSNVYLVNEEKVIQCNIRNITERKRAEEETRRATAAAEDANQELQYAFAREQYFARIDALTGVNNRRYWFELAEHEFEVATRYHTPLSVILFDIDHFKDVNDTFGHIVGDQVLERVALVARAALRTVDVIGRYGGEEFVIVLPATTALQAYPAAERIRADVAAIRVKTDQGPASVTLSIGIADTPLAPSTDRHGGSSSLERVVHHADEAMYAAKAAGRNRTAIYSAPTERPGASE
jgi:diguanylate cyclase (GGDEF)-like protein/PAS domain S-box-containing protein